ncbi:MAG: hypothetical protein R6T98_00525 [Desulfatiglandales bacterium]
MKNLVILPILKKTMGFFSVPRLPGWSFQHPSTSHFKKVHLLPVQRQKLLGFAKLSSWA